MRNFKRIMQEIATAFILSIALFFVVCYGLDQEAERQGIPANPRDITPNYKQSASQPGCAIASLTAADHGNPLPPSRSPAGVVTCGVKPGNGDDSGSRVLAMGTH